MDDRQLRLLFTAKEQRYSVSDLTRRIADLLAAEFTGIWVEGEVSGLKVSRQGHLYFSLRDREAILPCVCFRGAARLLRFRPEEGLAISARGRIDVYEARGQYQFIVEAIELRGQGALQAAFEKLKAQLAAEGLFSSERKRKLPSFPRRIGIITSPTGAAIRDILQILARRCPGLSIRIYPVSPTMISTSGILSTGEKKCRPRKLAGRLLTCARPEMGKVDVLEANTASAAMTASALRVHSALMARSSKTASITRSQPCRSS